MKAIQVLALSLPSPAHVEHRWERSLFIVRISENAIGSGRFY